MKSLAVESTGKIERGVAEVEKALEVGHEFDAFVLEHLVIGLFFIRDIHLVCETGTPTAGHGDAHKMRRRVLGVFGQDLYDAVPRCLRYKEHCNWV